MLDTRCQRPIWKSDKQAYKWGIAVTLSPGTPLIIRRCSTSFLWGTFATNNGTRPSLVSRKARRFPPCESRSVIHPNVARPSQTYLSSIGGLSSYPSYYQFISLYLSLSLSRRATTTYFSSREILNVSGDSATIVASARRVELQHKTEII